ncbi:MAG TPA: HAMP domain-containing protein [Candidatus Wallbacteria bacterium]|nr:MAG: Methyl-accepting chemotaxis protein McpB [bacterium ADurb.Bin243]HPG59834.1 HAMP domain-containing protein [Candidatus Wallbacteria bacterium]
MAENKEMQNENDQVVEAVSNENEEFKGGPKFKRRIFLIKRGLQFRYMGVIFVAMLLVAMIVGWTVYFSIWKDISDPTKKHDELVEVFVQGNQVLIARMTFIAVMICFLSVFVSHKIAGPVYRLEESAKIIASGDFSRRIKLRQGDELQDLADAFNTMTESLDKIIGEDQKMLQNLNLIIEKIKKDFKMKTIAENRKGEIINELQYIADELNKISSAFIVSDNSGPKENIGDDDSEEENA